MRHHLNIGARWSLPVLLALVLGILLPGGASTPAMAQDAGSLLREQQRREELQRLDRLPAPDAVETPARSGIVGVERGQTLVIRNIRFTGKLDLLPEAERAKIAAKAKGKRLGIIGIKGIADEVTIAIQQRGRLLGYAILPPQDITAGTVTIQLMEGRLSKIEFERKADVRIREEILNGLLHRSIVPDSVDKDTLEEALLRMNDLPGVTAKARLAPGESQQSSRLIIGVDQAPRFSGSLSGDNSGSYATGRAQATALINATDLTGYGDLTRMTGVVSEGQRFGQVAASLPIGASPFSLNANYAYLSYRNRDELGSALGLEGFAHYAGTGLDYSLIRSRDLNWRLSGTFNWKELADDSIVGRLQDKRSVSGTFGVSGDARDDFFGGGLTNWSASWTFGDLDLSRVDTALLIDQLTLQTQGKFQRFNVQLARLQKLPDAFSLFARLYGQASNKNLDSSEDFALGGSYGIRGYPVGEGRGDMGVIGTLELRYDAPVPATFGQLQLAGFVDSGHVWINRNPDGIALLNACQCNDYQLTSAGLSARWARENVSFSATWAQALGDNPGRSRLTGDNADGKALSQQFWLQGAVRF